jgi:hypothetical protein
MNTAVMLSNEMERRPTPISGEAESDAINPPLVDQSPLGYLDALQEPMENIALQASPNHGRFCARCYGRLGEPSRRRPSRLPASICAFCGLSTDEQPPVHRVPDQVLEIYMAKRRREGLIVNLFAFLGIFIALALSAVVWLITPDNLWKIAPFAVLVLGAYYLARVVGYNVGVPIGSASGRRLRNRRWLAYDAGRDLPPINSGT